MSRELLNPYVSLKFGLAWLRKKVTAHVTDLRKDLVFAIRLCLYSLLFDRGILFGEYPNWTCSVTILRECSTFFKELIGYFFSRWFEERSLESAQQTQFWIWSWIIEVQGHKIKQRSLFCYNIVSWSNIITTIFRQDKAENTDR